MSKLFIPYIMGDEKFITHLKVLQSTADYIEIGIPFSDPVADGPVIMKAGHRAIREGMTTERIFEALIEHQSEIHTNIILMTYMHMIESYGEKEFLERCEAANVFGLIIPDLPFELTEQFKSRHIHTTVKLIPLIAMTASDARIQKIASHAEGFIYTVTMNETTGQDGTFHNDLKNKLKMIQSYANVPVVAGFGIRTPQHVQDIASVADGVVIGSEIVKRFETEDVEDTKKYLKNIRTTLDEL